MNGGLSTVDASFPESYARSVSSMRIPAEWLDPKGSGPSFIPRLGPTGPLAPARVIRVVVADPHELFREGLIRHLAGQEDICVVDAVSSNREALAACVSQKVDVLLCADECASPSPTAAMAELRANSPETRMLVLSGEGAPTDEEALRAGAWGVVSRRQSADHFVRAIRAVADGQLWASRETLCRLAQIELAAPQPVAPKKARSLLSERESEIVQLLEAGLTNDRIAETLFVESSTVRTHLRRIFRKLGVHDRRSAVLAATAAHFLGLLG